MNTSLPFSKWKFHQRALLYKSFITALSTQPVLWYSLDEILPLILILLENDSPGLPQQNIALIRRITFLIFHGYFQIEN